MDENLQAILEEYEQSTVDLLLRINQLNPRPTVIPEIPLSRLFYLNYLLNGGTEGGASGSVSVTSLPVAFGAGAINATTQRIATASDSPEINLITTIRDRLTSDPATETTLAQVRDAIKAQLDIASTIWTDNSGAFYVRRDLINEGTGVITVNFTDPQGNAATPGAGLRPLATTDKDVLTDFYDVTTSGTGYSIGDLLSRVAVLDINNTATPSVTVIWIDLTTGAILGSAPTAAHIERANENIGARQVGTWNINNVAAIAQLPTSLGQKTAANSLAIVLASDSQPQVRLFDSVSNAQGTIKPGNTAPQASDTGVVVTQRPAAIAPTFTHLPLVVANTEYPIVLTSVKKYAFKVLSGGGTIRFSNVTEKVATPTLPYYTLDNTSEEFQDFGNFTFTGTLYFASSTAGTTVLIQYWT